MSDLPHVTTILQSAGLVDTKWFTEEDLARGTATHLATELLDQDDLDEDSLDPSIVGRIEAYKQFLEVEKPEWKEIEKFVSDETFGYCGTADRFGFIRGKWAVVDIKGPAQAKWHGVQLAAYAQARSPNKAVARYSLHLSDDGYKFIRHNGRNDWHVFLAALTIHNFKNEEKA